MVFGNETPVAIYLSHVKSDYPQKRIDEAREAYRNGEIIPGKTPKDFTDYLDSL